MSVDLPVRRDPFWLLLALVTLLGAAVRVKVAATEPPHFDESYTAVHYVFETAKTIVTTYDEPNNHVFHNLLAWVSTGLFGNGPFALRLPALIAGIALVPATGLLARATVRHARRAGGAGVAGLVAAGIVAAAPPLIAYSANARGYSIVLLLMVAQLGLTLRLARTPKLPAWAAWVLCGAVAIWTVPTAVLGVGVAATWLIALHGTQPTASADGPTPSAAEAATAGDRGRFMGLAQRLIAPVAAGVATAAVSLALYWPVLGQRGFTVDRFTAAPVKDLATTLAHAWAAGLAAPLIAVAVVLAVVGLWRRPRLGPTATLAVGLLAVPLAIAVLGRVLPYSRTYLFLLPILAVLAGVGAAQLLPQLERRGQAVPRAVAVAFAAIVFLAGATAQTREAWAEDPPGPSQPDLVAALGTALTTQLQDPLSIGNAPPLSLSGTLAAPPFDRPQVQYALVFGLGGDNGFEPVAPRDARASFTADPSPTADLSILTRSGVTPATALAALKLDPGAYETRSWAHGDAQVIAARLRR